MGGGWSGRGTCDGVVYGGSCGTGLDLDERGRNMGWGSYIRHRYRRVSFYCPCVHCFGSQRSLGVRWDRIVTWARENVIVFRSRLWDPFFLGSRLWKSRAVKAWKDFTVRRGLSFDFIWLVSVWCWGMKLLDSVSRVLVGGSATTRPWRIPG
jgi:hypothetical protein